MAYLKFELSLETKPSMLSMRKVGAGAFNRFFIRDSIFNFYPTSEFMIPDTAGLWTEENFPPEGLEFAITFSDGDTTIDHDFYLSEFSLADATNIEIVSGNIYFALFSSLRKLDSIKSFSVLGNGVTAVTSAMPVGAVPVTEPDTTIKHWRRAGQRFSDFARAVADYVESDSPYISFCNLRKEFVFKSLSSLLLSPAKARLSFGKNRRGDVGTSTVRNYIRSITYINGGAPVSGNLHKREVWYVDDSGNYNKAVYKSEVEPVLSEYANTNRVLTVYGPGKIRGWGKSLLKRTYLNHRLRVSTALNLDIVSGDVLDLEIDDSTGKSKYSGKWLVVEAGHGFGGEGNAVSLLELGRPDMALGGNYPLIGDIA